MDTIILAVLSGVAVLLAGNVPWGVLVSANQRFGLTTPWAIAPMTLYLWVYWRAIGGSWGPRGSEAALRGNLRANRVAGSVWAPALLAGLLGFATLLALLTVITLAGLTTWASVGIHGLRARQDATRPGTVGGSLTTLP